MAKRLTEDQINWILSLDASGAEQEVRKLSKENAALAERNKDVRRSLRQLEAQGKKNTDNYRSLTEEYKKNSERMQANRQAMQRLDEQMGVANLSMTQLKRRAKDLQTQLNGTSQALHPEEWKRLNDRLAETRQRMSQLNNSAGEIEEQMGGYVRWMDKLKLAAKALVAVKLAEWMKAAHDRAYETRKEFARYEAVLRNTFQSQERANDAMRMLQQLAAQTPASLQEWTEAYIKLVNRGITPTAAELTAFGDLAASQGKSIDQLVEAALDAMTKENERLKEFGVRASVEGETTQYTFRGVTTEVRNTDEAIKDYLLSLGRLEGVAGSMAVQMEEIEGLQSNLGDSMDVFFNKVGKKLEPFWKGLMKRAKGFFDGLGGLFTTYTETYETHFDRMVQLQGTLPRLMERYDELTSAASLTASGQEELASVVRQVAEMVPGAATAFDGYGRAVSLSAEKVDEFIRRQKALLQYENARAIREEEESLERLRKQYDRLNEAYQHGRTVIAPNGMGQATAYNDTSDETRDRIQSEMQKVGALIEGAEEKLKRLKGETIDEAVKTQQEAAEARSRFNEMNRQQLDAWIKDEKNAADQYLALAKEVYAKRFPAPTKKEQAQAAKAEEKADNSAARAAEREARAVIATEKAAARSLGELRQEELTARQQTYNEQAAALAQALNEGKLTKEQHEMMMLQLEQQHAEAVLQVERTFYEDSQTMALTDADTKERLVRESGERVVKAEKEAADARLAVQTKLNTLVKDFKTEFKVTTVDEDYRAQTSMLEAAYRARLEMARQNQLDTTELDKAYYRAKEQLETDHQQRLFALRSQYGLTTQKEQLDMQLEQLKQSLDNQELTQEEYETATGDLKRKSYVQQAAYYTDLFAGAVNSLQEAEMADIDAKYDAEIAAAQGNAEEVERLENEKAQKKLDVQKKYADVNFAITVSQIIANTAASIMQAFAQLGPIAGAVAAALMGVTGAAQIAAANAERNKVKNMTLEGSDSSQASYKRVATGLESGGKIDVVRSQDGKLFPDARYDPDRRGFIDRPTVIVGEGPAGRSREWVASNAAVENPTVAPVLDLIDRSQQAGTVRTLDLNKAMRVRLAGYSAGGSPSAAPPPRTTAPATGGSAVMERLAAAIERMEQEGIPASVTLTEIERKQRLRDRARRMGSKKSDKFF